MKKRIISLLLAMLMVIGMAMAVNAEAADDQTEEITIQTQSKAQTASTFAWSDEWLINGNAYEYNHNLAITGGVLSSATYGNSSNSDMMIKAALIQMGCSPLDIVTKYALDYTNEEEGGVNQAAYAIARKVVPTENGNKEILYIVVRGTASKEEWLSNINISNQSNSKELYHEGFDIARQQILTQIISYATQHAMDLKNTSVYVVGHSRGGAIANLIGAQLDLVAKQGALGLSADKIFTYTYATPNTTSDETASSELYQNIYNIINPEDLITMVPFTQWGYQRYGIDKVLYSSSFISKEEYQARYTLMNTVFKQLNGYDYINMEGGTILSAKLPQAIVGSLAPTVEKYYANKPFSLYQILFTALSQQKNAEIAGISEDAKAILEELQTQENDETQISALIQALFQLCGIQANTSEAFTHMHLPQTYLAWLMSGQENCFYTGTSKSLSIKGAADFVLTDSNNQVVCQVENGVINAEKTDPSCYPIMDRTKTVFLTVPMTQEYRLTITAKTDTTVDIVAEHYTNGLQVDGQRPFVGTQLKANEVYSLILPSGEDLSGIQEIKPEEKENISYSTHVQNIGWMTSVSDGETSGTTGRNLRLEGIRIDVSDSLGEGSVEYCTHVSNIGWGDWKKDGETSGTTGRGLRLEAIRIRLTGELAEKYDIYYSVHIQNMGWMNWAKNGEAAGSQGQSLRLEGIRIQLVEKGASAPETINPNNTSAFSPVHLVEYQTYVQNLKWQDKVYDGAMGGTSGKSLRLEAIQINTTCSAYTGSIQYRTHIQNIGWESTFKNANEISGTRGKSLRLEAIQIRLTEELAQYYDVYYRVHVQNQGWTKWVMNGETAGTTGKNLRLEAIRIQLVEKGKQPS